MQTLLKTEFRLFRREPMIAFWGLAFPVVLLVVLGSLTSQKPQKDLGGVSFITAYTPVLTVFSLALLSLSGLPTILTSYRDKGYLRRLSTTPVGAWRLLAAEVTIMAGLVSTVIVIIWLVAHFAFHGHLPQEFGGWLLAVVLVIAAMLAAGMVISALAPSQRIASIVGSLSFFVMMFFAGLWVPQAEMGATLRTISHYTPLGAGVPAVQTAAAGAWPGTVHLLVLAGYAVLFSAVAARYFRWDK